jgi:lipid-A-disaccharide synthase
LGIPLVHYVAPQHWGWRPGRVKKLAAKVDRVLALLPFEAPWFEAHGITVDFVGHPVLESGLDRGDGAAFRARHGVAEHERLVMVMPGSRRTEVSRLLPVFGAALALLPPGLRAVVPVAGPVEEAVRAGLADWPLQPILLDGVAEKADAFAACEAGLIKSGTSTLEAAVAGLPHLVAYKVNPITAAIVRRLMQVRFISIVNLLAEREVAPEFVQDACTPEILAQGLRALLDGGEMPTARAWNKVHGGTADYAGNAESQRRGFAEVLGRLRPAGLLPSEAAAEAVLAVLDR